MTGNPYLSLRPYSPLSKPRTCRVVGVTFAPHYPENLLHLAAVAARHERAGVRIPVQLVRNPANTYDANAVEVHVPALGHLAMVGHISKDEAAALAPRMDCGELFVSEVSWCRIDPNNTDRPGIDITIARILDRTTMASIVEAAGKQVAAALAKLNLSARRVALTPSRRTGRPHDRHGNARLLARSRRNRRGR